MTYREIKFEERLNTLSKVLNIYVKLMRHYGAVDINVNRERKIIEVKYKEPKGDWWEFEAVEFPFSDLNKRLTHYKRKVFTAFKNRHKPDKG